MSELKPGQRVRSITLPDGEKLNAGAPDCMEIYMEPGLHCGIPYVRRWNNYEDFRYPCHSLVEIQLAVDPERPET